MHNRANSDIGRVQGTCPTAENQPIAGLIAIVVALVLGSFTAAGCDHSDAIIKRQTEDLSAGDSHLASTATSPRLMIENCIAKYRSLTSYEDRAYVRLAYRTADGPQEDRAPLSVAWDASGKLGLRAYSVSAGPNEQGRWHLRLGESFSELQAQVLSRRVPEQLTWEWLFSEPLISESLSAGLAGFPPQLDLLLSANPMSRLLDDSAVLSVQREQSLDGHRCSVVVVQHGALAYTFWVDQQDQLLRRLQLPSQLLPAGLLQDAEIADVSLSIEFIEPQIDRTIDWSKFTIATSHADLLVNHFVPPRPKLNTRQLGEQIPAFQLPAPNGTVAYDSTPTKKRRASVLMWLADHPACLAAAEQMQVTMQQLSQMGISAEAVEYVPIWAEPAAPQGMNYEQLQQRWQLPGRLAVDREAAGRDLFQVEEAPTVVVLDGDGKLQFIDVRLNPTLDRALAPIVARVAQGADVAGELIQSEMHSQDRFQGELALAAAADAGVDQREFAAEYPMETIQLHQIQQIEFEAPIAGITQDSTQSIWVYTAAGKLQQLSDSLELLETYLPQWPISRSGRMRLQSSPDSRIVASHVGENEIAVFDVRSSESLRFPVRGSVIDMQWLLLSGGSESRLAVVTDSKQVVLLDPTNKEQLSGTSDSEPLAIVPVAGREEIGGAVVLKNRLLEPLKADRDARSLAPARPVVHTLPNPTSAQRLDFSPAHGPWLQLNANGARQILATGWLADEEPALFVLDEQLKPMWQLRQPFAPRDEAFHQLAGAVSPGNGAVVWAALDSRETIHLMRGDVRWADHFRPAVPSSWIALIPYGDRLVLVVAGRNTLTAYRLD